MKAYRGEILSVPEDPAIAGAEAIRHFEDGLLVVEEGFVLGCGAYDDLATTFGTVPAERLEGLIGPDLAGGLVRALSGDHRLVRPRWADGLREAV